MLARKAVEKVGETAEGHQKADENSVDPNQRVEENTEKIAQNVDEDTQEVAEILASNMSMEEDVQVEQMEFTTGFDLNIEDVNTDFNNEVFQDGQDTTQHAQEPAAGQNVEISEAQNVEIPAEDVPVSQNVQVSAGLNASNEPLLAQVSQLSADPVPMASGSLPSAEVQLMAQTGQNVNLSSSTMGSVAGASNFLVSNLPTPDTIPSYTPPPPPMKTTTTSKLPNMAALFDSLNTFVTANREKAEASDAAPPTAPAKPSRAEKLASRALRVSTKTHKIVCALADWTTNVHAPGLAIPGPIFVDQSIFDEEPSSDSGDSTP